MTKDELRSEMKAQLKAHSSQDLRIKSQSLEASLIQYLCRLDHQSPLSVIGMYLPMRGEPQWDWSRWGSFPWKLSFPSNEGGFKIPKSIPLSGQWVSEGAVSEADILIIPGLAFSKSGYRLGRGAGWYDKLLAKGRPRFGCVGVCFEHQFGHEFSVEAHDQKVQMILTDQRMQVID